MSNIYSEENIIVNSEVNLKNESFSLKNLTNNPSDHKNHNDLDLKLYFDNQFKKIDMIRNNRKKTYKNSKTQKNHDKNFSNTENFKFMCDENFVNHKNISKASTMNNPKFNDFKNNSKKIIFNNFLSNDNLNNSKNETSNKDFYSYYKMEIIKQNCFNKENKIMSDVDFSKYKNSFNKLKNELKTNNNIRTTQDIEIDNYSLNRLNKKENNNPIEKNKKMNNIKLVLLNDDKSNLDSNNKNNTLICTSDVNLKDSKNILVLKNLNNLNCINSEIESNNKLINYEKLKISDFYKNKEKNENLKILSKENNLINLKKIVCGDKEKYLRNSLNDGKINEKKNLQNINNNNYFILFNKSNTDKGAEHFKKNILIKEDFDSIFQTSENQPTMTKEYLEYINSFDINKNKYLSKEYCIFPLIKDETLICKIKIHLNKNKLGITHPMYSLHINNSTKSFIGAKKINIGSASQYIFSLDENNFNTKSVFFIGKLKSNFIGNKFKILNYKIKKNYDEKLFIDNSNNNRNINCDEINYVNINKLFFCFILI